MGTIREDLGRGAVEVRETHISWVFLHEADVYKVKKPVSLGFLDFSTAEARRKACEAEVALNRRLAPHIYLGVVPVTRGRDGVYALGGDGDIVEHAVHMLRLPDADRADIRLADGRLTEAHVETIARDMAVFHASARADEETARHGGVEAIARNVVENFEQTRATIDAHLTTSEAAEIEGWQRAVLRDRTHVFQARTEAGRVRDGHGDLRLEHVYLPDDGTPATTELGAAYLDCIEFNERFRFADVCADVAFLSMDLAWNGRVDLAERFLALYARESNDYDLYEVVDFYESYRAYVRGKIAAWRAADEGVPLPDRASAATEARRYFKLAQAADRRPFVPPLVVAVGGLIASGKSTMSAALGVALGAPVVDSDRTRKHMVGVAATRAIHDGSAWGGAYDPAFTEEVYDEVYRRAGVVLASGRPVILDASFRSASMRADARRLADEHGVPFLFVECRIPRHVAMERLEERARHEHVSDGRAEIWDDFAARWEDAVELPPGRRVVLDTTRPVEELIDSLRARVPLWPEGGGG